MTEMGEKRNEDRIREKKIREEWRRHRSHEEHKGTNTKSNQTFIKKTSVFSFLTILFYRMKRVVYVETSRRGG